MYIAMNRFKVIVGEENAFEQVWRSRESRLHEMNGYVSFDLLRSPQQEDYTLYASHTVWANREDFQAWTQSEQFRDAHKNAGKGRPLTTGHPVFEGFDAVSMEAEAVA
ncbi:antibiotic biosynthesis monooxygenase family protein [Lichenihabitans psoromatis]|uniref:antibiotic biosynthesis monooxygenase family protein n=1 Tax=Lichenihabitans psoromatis TaxID=2528642 RepID=UPI0010384239|nr:antibiotic biosynthesis monooxygenase [Lichenihabitans psoromatis]